MERPILVAVLLLASTAVSSAPTPFEITGIRSGLARSPGDYVAAVVEFRGAVDCTEFDWGRRCWSYVAVLDEMASRPGSKSPRAVLRMSSAGEGGERLNGRAIAFLVPMEGTDIYTPTFISVYSRSGHQRFQQAVELAISGSRSL